MSGFSDGLKGFFGKISDMIPNEFSKLNSLTMFLPPPFNFLAQIPAAVDRFGESYSNDSGFFDSLLYGGKAFMGSAGDPNMRSPKNRGMGFGDDDWSYTIGKMIGMFPNLGGGGGFGGGIPNISMGIGNIGAY